MEQCSCLDYNEKWCRLLIITWTNDELKYRAMGWFDLANWCSEMVHQIKMSNYGHLCSFNGMI